MKDEWEKAIKETKWIYAKSYALTHPHWYIREHEHPQLAAVLKELIRSEGVMEDFKNHRGDIFAYRYWYHDEYKYWYIPPVINRARI